MEKATNPLESIGTTQGHNKNWWESHPMTYEAWDGTSRISHDEDSIEFYREVDGRFFESAKHFAHPLSSQAPFSALIDFPALRDKRLLEVGCGMGAHAELFARAAARVTAIDITEMAIRRTTKRFTLNKLEGVLLEMDASNMIFPDESFDYVWSWGVIHHAEDPEAIVREIYRVLVPGGRAQIMVYHKNSLRYYLYGGLRKGVFHGKLFHMSLYEVNKSFTDGAIARHYSKKDVNRMFSKFRLVQTRIFDAGQEAYIPMIGKHLRKVFPDSMKHIDAWLLSRFGWFLFIEVMK
jgi:ubiquinone/menaquinone biosynthesis C-methylase UbiE